MRPHFGNSGDAWVLQKEEQDIVPANLKTRDLLKYPQRYFHIGISNAESGDKVKRIFLFLFLLQFH